MHANPGSYEEYQEDVRKTKAARLAHGEAARSRTATESPRDKGAAKSVGMRGGTALSVLRRIYSIFMCC